MSTDRKERGLRLNALVGAVATAWVLSVLTVFVVARLPLPMTVNHLRSGMIVVGGGSGEGQIIVTTQPDGGPKIVLYDSAHKSIGELGSAPNGAPRLSLNVAGGPPLLMVEITPKGQPRVRLTDPSSGKPVWTVSVDESGAPLIEPR